VKKTIIAFVLGTLLSAGAFAFAADQPIRLIVNGKDITDQFDVKPMIYNDRTLVPARPLAEALGATVEWDEQGQAVVVNNPRKLPDSPKPNLISDYISIQSLGKMHNSHVGGKIIDGAMTFNVGDFTLTVPKKDWDMFQITEQGTMKIWKNGKEIGTVNFYDFCGNLYLDRKIIDFLN